MQELLGTLAAILILVALLVMLAKPFSKNMGAKQKKGWLIAHIIFVIVYFGGLLGTLLLTSLAATIIDPDQTYAVHLSARYFDWFLIIPGAFGSMITGIWMSVRTQWGFTRYYWIIFKTLGNIGAILYGSTWMRLWFDKTITLSSPGQANFQQSPAYLHNHQMLIVGTIISLAILFILLLISYLKPWGKRMAATC